MQNKPQDDSGSRRGARERFYRVFGIHGEGIDGEGIDGGARGLKRGEVYWARLAPRSGSEQTGRRPVIVLSHDAFNTVPTWRSVIVVPVSTPYAKPGAVRPPYRYPPEWAVLNPMASQCATKSPHSTAVNSPRGLGIFQSRSSGKSRMDSKRRSAWFEPCREESNHSTARRAETAFGA